MDDMQCETEGARFDPTDAALLAVREDADRLRRYSAHTTDYLLGAIARAAVAQAMLAERLAQAMETLTAAAVDDDGK